MGWRHLSTALQRHGAITAPMVGILSALLLATPAQGHLLDEVAESLLCDLQTDDRKTLVATWYLEAGRVEAYFEAAEAIGEAPDRSAAAFARRLATGFSVPGCSTEPDAPAEVDAGKPGMRAFRVRIQCPEPLRALRVERVAYSRERTRATVYLSLRVQGAPPRRLLLPPRVAALEVPLDGRAARATVGKGAQRADAAADPQVLGTGMPRPGDPQPLDALPPAGRAPPLLPPPPPVTLLLAWARIGAEHLLGGVDHLLFLLGLVLACARLPALFAAVAGFSLGHLATMAAAILLGWPSMRWVEVAIGLSVVAAALAAARERERRLHGGLLALGALLFGLVHGAAFGAELRRSLGVSDGLIWPLAAFGVGLDAAQSAVALLAHAVAQRALNTDRARRGAAVAVGIGGVAFAARAFWS